MANCNQLPALLSEVQRSRDSLPSDPIQFCREDTDNRRGFFRCLQNIEQARQGYNQEIADLQQKISLCEIFTGSAWNVSVRSLSAVVANRDSGRLQITSWDTDGLGPFVATMVFSQGGTGQFSFSAFNAFTREIWFIIPPLVYHGTLYALTRKRAYQGLAPVACLHLSSEMFCLVFLI